jgi:hypothetical protein
VTDQLEHAKRSILKIGTGRGFVVGNGEFRYVITVAHCLPWFPPCHALENHTYGDLLGPLDGATSVWAECCFLDDSTEATEINCPKGYPLARRRTWRRAWRAFRIPF